MLNKERIRLMTRLAAYEQGEGKEDMPVAQYYRRDYVGLMMLRTFISSTIAFFILFALKILYELDLWIAMLYKLSYQKMLSDIMGKYLVFVLLYQVIAYFVYNFRYRKTQKKQKLYHSRIKKVQKLYEREEKLLPLDDWEE